MAVDANGQLIPVQVRLTREGEDEIQKLARHVALIERDATGAYAGTLGKARGQALRLSAILEFAWWAGAGGEAEPTSISTKAVVSACGLVAEYFLPMAERVFGDAAIPGSERGAMALGRHLRRHRLHHFNARSVRLAIGGSLRKAEDMSAACNELVEAGLIRPQDRRPAVGRTPKTFDVHPAVYRSA